MSNWITNILSVSGKYSLKDIMKDISIGSYDNEDITISFNKIIPQPEKLNVISGITRNYAISAYYSSCDCLEKEEIEKLLYNYNKTHYLDRIKYDLPFNDCITEKELTKAGCATIEEYGKRYIENIEKYGCPDWYEWRMEVWGTKWGANSVSYSPYSDCNNTIIFITANTTPMGIIKALSIKYPDTVFTVIFADEDYGYNLGKYSCCNGELIKDFFPEPNSIEALNIAGEVLGPCEVPEHEWNDKLQSYVKKEK